MATTESTIILTQLLVSINSIILSWLGECGVEDEEEEVEDGVEVVFTFFAALDHNVDKRVIMNSIEINSVNLLKVKKYIKQKEVCASRPIKQ